MEVLNINDMLLEILKSLDMKDLYTLCTLDKNFMKKCENINFWKPYFEKKGLPLPNYDYAPLNIWLFDLAKYKLAMDKTQMQMIDLEKSSRFILLEDLKEPKILDIEGVDYESIYNLFQQITLLQQIEYISDTYINDIPSMILQIEKNLNYNMYVIYFEKLEPNEEPYKFYVSEKTFMELLFELNLRNYELQNIYGI